MPNYLDEDDDSADLCGLINDDGVRFCILKPGHESELHFPLQGKSWRMPAGG